MLTEARFKDGLRDLVRACGGLEKAAAIADMSTTNLARLYDHKEDQRAHFMLIARLEAACGRPVVTIRAAEAVEPFVESIQLTEALMATAVKVGGLLREGQEATSDGRVTNIEKARLRRALNELMDAARTAGRAIEGGAA